MLTLLLAAHAAPQRFVQDEYLKLAREGKALDWHPNRWAAELVIHPDHLELALQDGPAEQCSYTSSPRADVMILTADCPSGPKQLVRRGNRITVALLWGNVTLEPSEHGVIELHQQAQRKLSTSVLPKLEGTWRRGDSRLQLDASAFDVVQLAPCAYEQTQTVCMQRANEGFVLLDGELRPAAVYNDDGGSMWWANRLLAGASWLREQPCTRAICSIQRTADAEVTRWVPLGPALTRELMVTENLLGGTLQIEHTAERLEVRLRAHTRGAVYLEDHPVGWGDLGATTAWIPLGGTGSYELPATITPAPVSLSADQREARIRAMFSEETSSVPFRDRAIEAARACATDDTRPCVTGIGAIDLEIRAFKGAKEVDRFVLTLQRGFGC